MQLIQREVRDPRVTSVTITGVRVASDLGHARVFVTTLPTVDRPTVIQGLRAAAPFLRTQLGRLLRIRRVPDLDFLWDETLDRAQRIERLLADVLPHEAARADEAAQPDPTDDEVD